MGKALNSLLQGYKNFREEHYSENKGLFDQLSSSQKPQVMVISCCDSRVDPGLLLGCEPGDLFVVRNVANIVPPYELDDKHHGTSAALEFGVRFLEIKDLIILGHSDCGGIKSLITKRTGLTNDFINNWVSIVEPNKFVPSEIDECARHSLKRSYQNCLTFPWIEGRMVADNLRIHLWFFDIKSGQILSYDHSQDEFLPLNTEIK